MRAFISYSSKDRVYAEALSNSLGDFLILDYKSFEEGGKTLDEILEKLDQTDIYVLLLSRDAVQSKWVQEEIKQAKDRIDAARIRKIVPINIDKGLPHDDPRIPAWIRDSSYSLRPVLTPGKASLIINRHLLAVSDAVRSNTGKRIEPIFYNRHQEMATLTQRVADIERPRPTTILASGMSKVGRRTLLKHMLTTLNISLTRSRVFAEIILEPNESIGDFVLKLDSLELTTRIDRATTNLKDEKVCANLLERQILEIAEQNETIIVEDRGSIVLRNGHVGDWFLHAISKYYVRQKLSAKLVFCVASQYRPSAYLRDDALFHLEVNDFAKQDLIGLAKLLLDNQQITITKDHLDYLSKALSGYPDQAYLAASQISSKGLQYANDHILSVQDLYVKDVMALLQEETADGKRLSLVLTLARYDLFSLPTLKQYLFDYTHEELFEIVSDLEHKSIISFYGAAKEFFALNKIVKDFVSRRTYHLHPKYQQRAREIAKTNALSSAPLGDDISLFYSSVRDALVAGFKINNQFVLPSHYIKAIEILYNVEKKYSDVVQIGDYVLQNNPNLDKLVVRDIRYFQCLSLARLRDRRCLDVVKHFDAYDHYFLTGFYYRKCGMYEDAVKFYKKALEHSDVGRKARRELVLVYNRMEMFSEAYDMAKQNFEADRNNAFYLQAYIESLIRVHPKKSKLILELIDELDQNRFEYAKEMAVMARADYHSHIAKDIDEALRVLGAAQASSDHGESTYIVYKEFQLAEMKGDMWRMHDAFERYKKITESGKQRDANIFMLMEARIFANVGEPEKALENIDKLYYPQSVKEKWKRQLKLI